MDQHQDIINLIKSTPSIEPPDDLTPRVMEAVMEAREGVFERAWDFLSMPRESTLKTISAFQAGIGNMELVWHFLIAGFIYAIIGASLLVGLSEFKHVTVLSEWIAWQPFLWLASALLCVLCGVVLYAGAGGNRGLNLVRFYMFFHIGFVIINGIFISLSSALPLTIIFAVFFALPVIVVGISLFIDKDRTGKFLSKGEIFSHAVQ
jgi:hypothetical protein